MIINIRGTSGSGKSTLVRAVMGLYDSRVAVKEAGRRRPAGYLCSRVQGNRLAVPGHYETPCGGCDTIKKQPQIQAQVRQAHLCGCDVLYEGLLSSEESGRTIEMIRDGLPLTVFLLNTPVDVCIERINARRRAKKPDAPPVAETNTRQRVGVIQRACSKIIAAEGTGIIASPEDALCRIKSMLQLA